jgi:hydrogenase-4 component E
MAHKRIKSYIGTLRMQSVLIAAATLAAGVKNSVDKGGIDLFVVSLIIIAVKAIYIPNKLHKTWASVEYTVEKDFLMNIPMLVIICCGIVVLTFFCVSNVLTFMDKSVVLPIVNSISIVLIGLFFIISRKKAIGQIVGLVVIENGLFTTALFASNGLPFIVDMGIFVDLITSVLIMGIMVFKINEHHGSIDTDN